MKFRQNGFLALGRRALLIGSMVATFSGPMIEVTHAAQAAPVITCTPGSVCNPGSVGGSGGTIGGGTLTSNSFAPVVNNGAALTSSSSDQTIPIKFLTTVSDARGTGAGWHVTVGATAVAFGTGETSDLVLDPDVPATITCATRSTCSSPAAITIGGAGADLTTTTPTVADAAANTGIGAYNIWTYGSFTIPGGAGGSITGGALSVTVANTP
jgi:hypothetical protein